MNNRTMLALLLAAASAFVAAGEAEEFNLRAAKRDMAMFHELDANRDGFLTRQEVGGVIDLLARFDDVDINRDGRISTAEMTRYVQARYQVSAEQVGGAATRMAAPSAATQN